MKRIYFFTFLFLSALVYAETENPADFCNQIGSCTNNMRAIANQYRTGNAEFAKEDLIGMSGSCYHLNSIYDPEHEHHGAFLFEHTADQGLLATGIFSFFASEDPYKNMSTLELKEWFKQNQSNYAKAIEQPSQVELHYLEAESDLHYWFRSNEDYSKIFMIGKQSFGFNIYLIFCEMNLLRYSVFLQKFSIINSF